MPLSKIQFTPGIIREVTNYTNAGGWYMADKVRFRRGNPETMGGWLAVTATPFEGVCRHIHQWSDVESNRYDALGTTSHLYILWGEQYYDITPVLATSTNLSNPFATTAGSTTVTVTDATANNQVRAGDFINVAGTAAGSPVPDGQYQVATVVAPTPPATQSTQFTIELPTPAATTGSGGGAAVQIQYLIHTGLADAIVGQGWGIPPWGGSSPGAAVQTGWGEPYDLSQLYPADPTVTQLRVWDIDNFGEDLVANIRGGPIYYWTRANGLETPAVPLPSLTSDNPPLMANQILVSPNDRHLIAMGCNDVGSSTQDLLLVRWCAAEDVKTWTPLRTNDAGGMRLGAGSFIVSAMRTAQTILIWTDLGLWAMSYIGMPYVFGFQEVAEGLSILGPNAMINIGSAVLWMDRGIFYAYTGQVQELPCALKDYIFSDINFFQGYKIYAGHNHAYSEVIWFYPSLNSTENDSYVIYNYSEQLWSMGKMVRTAWLDMGRCSYPIATDRANGGGLLYYHEYGSDANGQPLTHYIDSADIDLNGGESYVFLSRFLPDVQFRGTGDEQEVGVTIFGRSAPLEPKRALARLQVTPHTGLQFVRVRERQISFRFESENPGTAWRLGTIRADIQPDGRR